MFVLVPATIPVMATAPAAATQMMVTDFFTDDPPGVRVQLFCTPLVRPSPEDYYLT
jgi:hypothetical protein